MIFLVHLRPCVGDIYVHHRYTHVKWQSKRAREHENTILGVASSPNYYFTRRSCTSRPLYSVRILFYRDIIVELECHGVTAPSPPPSLVSFRGTNVSPTFRYFAIEEILLEDSRGIIFLCSILDEFFYRLTIKCTIYIDLYRCF